jgi:SAM-dependent methyltransferase
VLHHVRRPELAVSELARVARPGGKVFIVDQLGSIDPLLSLEMDRFERLRDATHQRLLPDTDIRGYLDANDLVLISSEVTRELVDLEERLVLGGFDEEERVRIRGPAPAKPYEIEVGWYVSRKPGM